MASETIKSIDTILKTAHRNRKVDTVLFVTSGVPLIVETFFFMFLTKPPLDTQTMNLFLTTMFALDFVAISSFTMMGYNTFMPLRRIKNITQNN